MNSVRSLSRASTLQRSCASITRTFSSTARSYDAAAALKVSTPLAPKPKAKTALPVSAAPAGTPLKGLNHIKGKDDPVALPEDEYPEWLWRCLDSNKEEGATKAGEGDEFSKSKKIRRLAAKRQRKLEEQMLASGNTEAFEPKIPLQQQTIDLPANEEGSVEGSLEAVAARAQLRKAMRNERRAKIKEANFLKGMN